MIPEAVEIEVSAKMFSLSLLLYPKYYITILQMPEMQRIR